MTTDTEEIHICRFKHEDGEIEREKYTHGKVDKTHATNDIYFSLKLCDFVVVVVEQK